MCVCVMCCVLCLFFLLHFNQGFIELVYVCCVCLFVCFSPLFFSIDSTETTAKKKTKIIFWFSGDDLICFLGFCFFLSFFDYISQLLSFDFRINFCHQFLTPDLCLFDCSNVCVCVCTSVYDVI